MSNVVIEFQEDTQTAFCLYVAYHDGDFLCVQHISKGDLVEYRLSPSHVQSIKAVSSLSDLLAYAKANHIQQPQAETLCPCPPETSDTAAIGGTDDVDGGIFSIVKRLKEIKEEINQLNGSAFEKSLLSDAQHYQLLDVEMFIGDFIARSVPASEGVDQ